MFINNPVLKFFLTTLDFPIRWVYCRLPNFLRSLFFGNLYDVKFQHLDSRIEDLSNQLAEIGYSLDGKICLELGPGNSYFNAYYFLLQGAENVILVDKFPRFSNSQKQQLYYAREFEHIKHKYSRDNFPFGSEAGPNPEYIQLLAGDLTDIKIPQQVDLVYSHHVLEHVKDVTNTLKGLHQVMRAGAVAYHVIDLRDHYNFNTPFLFYKYSPQVWEHQLSKEGVSYTNRLRVDDFIVKIKQAGFQILKLETKQYPIQTRTIAKVFADKDEKTLMTGKAVFLLKK